ncbi:hypothetical protein PanWU01x14_362680 [Parasponia andersonii]|uniref:Uncharacterized protein n=1 Tax=Parasponia andersonii TaxID=3476 RepID=A0A2P5A6W2_PARAD|nr:hypothetical protein PanWU01x14_362680 [Parasponia andersonii]
METIHNLQFESLYDSLEATTRAVAIIIAQVINNDESQCEEPSASRKTLGLFDYENSSEEENQE